MLKRKAWRISLLAASAILSSFFQTAVAVVRSEMITRKNQNMVSSVQGTTAQKSQSYGPNSVKISPSGNTSWPLGSSLTLTCSADSVPVPEYHWFFNNSRRNVTGNRFTINSTSLEDQGMYECHAYNSETNITVWASVFVRITDQVLESSSAHLEQTLKVAWSIFVGLFLVVMLLVGILLYHFCPKFWGENSPLTRSTPSIYDDVSPATQGTKPETSADPPSNTCQFDGGGDVETGTEAQTLQHGDEALYEELQK